MMRFFFGLVLVSTLLIGCGRSGSDAPPAASSLTVTAAQPVTRPITREVAASGSVAAWQEMSLGVELAGLRSQEPAQVERPQVTTRQLGSPLAPRRFTLA